MASKLRWGIIGSGAIAGDFTKALADSSRCEVVSVAGSSPDKSRAFAERFALPGYADSIEALLDDARVEAVYIATPHPMHEAHALACIDAGKHVLCEKPVTMDAPSAERVIDAARSRGVCFMEAFMYRCHPMTRRIIDELRSGVIGPIRHVRADFGFYAPRRPEHRLFNPALGGGGILDVGGYPASFARLIAGVASDQPFDEPAEVCAHGHLGPTGVDELACAQLRFASGLTAQITCAVNQDVGTGAWVLGERGVLHIPDPWTPSSDRHSRVNRYSIRLHDEPPSEYAVTTDLAIYAIEAELFADAIGPGRVPWPAMSPDDTLGNMRLLDAWREQVGSAQPATA